MKLMEARLFCFTLMIGLTAQHWTNIPLRYCSKPHNRGWEWAEVFDPVGWRVKCSTIDGGSHFGRWCNSEFENNRKSGPWVDRETDYGKVLLWYAASNETFQITFLKMPLSGNSIIKVLVIYTSIWVGVLLRAGPGPLKQYFVWTEACKRKLICRKTSAAWVLLSATGLSTDSILLKISLYNHLLIYRMEQLTELT